MKPETRLPESAQRVADMLRRIGHGQPVVLLPASGRTSAEAAAGLGCRVAEIAKSIIFRRLADDTAVMVVASGANRVDEGKVAALVGPLGKADASFGSKARARGEHAFHVVKRLWGFAKVRYRGLAKNTAQLQTLFALVNLGLARCRAAAAA